MNKVEPQVITGWATGPNAKAGNVPYPLNFKKGGAACKMKKLKKGGSKNGYQNGPAGFGY
tara:strand:+ start:122 stop:301 length:180 start_codon:yes stop_codon:yes gene_type:complete